MTKPVKRLIRFLDRSETTQDRTERDIRSIIPSSMDIHAPLHFYPGYEATLDREAREVVKEFRIYDGGFIITYYAFKAYPTLACPASAVEVTDACDCDVRDLWTFGHKCGRIAPIDKKIQLFKR